MIFRGNLVATFTVVASALVIGTAVADVTEPYPVQLRSATVHRKQDTCPGSNARLTHAKCSMNIEFPSVDCDLVKEEIFARVNASAKNTGKWIDPHNGGIYTLVDKEENMNNGGSITLDISRLSGNRKYVDLVRYTLETDPDTGTCNVAACSESQVTSVIDYSTNYCNIRNLYCCSNDGCQPVKHDFSNTEIVEEYLSCSQRDVEQCIVEVEED